MKRVEGKLERVIDDKQYGFMKGKSARNAIEYKRMLTDRTIALDQGIFIRKPSAERTGMF